jgi:orotidine-5'-phosphate decarboxylase
VEGRIITLDRSVIVAMDMNWRRTTEVIDKTKEVEGISAYKFGFRVGLSRLSLPVAVDYVHENTNKKAIYDHQKAGTDIDDTAQGFADTLHEAGVDAAILFPFTGPVVERAWIKVLQQKGIGVIVGAEMTHKQIRHSEGGFVADDAFKRMFEIAVDCKVTDFVVPGNKPDKVREYRALFEHELGEGNFDLYSPGLIAQGGTITEGGEAAGPRFHGIIGRGIFEQEDIHAAAVSCTTQIGA